ncbi:hypothetical protein Y695_00082 [Hydrogenophaga sp. T4]|nr:hypothetical protein Y695_00082 [Hydrogenophaga sp. T4]
MKKSLGPAWAFAFGVVRVVMIIISVPAGWLLKLAFGRPQITPVARTSGVLSVPRTAEPKLDSAPSQVPEQTVKQAIEPVVSVESKPVAPNSAPSGHALGTLSTEGSDRIRTMELVSGGLLVGVLWLYLYPNDKIVRRVFKVQDAGLSRVLGFKRYYYPDVSYVPADGSKGTDKLMDEFFDLVQNQLDRRTKTAVARAPQIKLKPIPIAKDKREKPVEAVVEKAAPVVVTNQEQQASKPFINASAPMKVEGVPHVGLVSHLGMTRKPGKKGSYETFCLTLNDGKIEVPFFGVEIARLVEDMRIQPGERIKVVYMGKQDIPSTEGGQGYKKNLYKITRMDAA